jgi:PAS domain S-box-containing protein
MNSAEFQLQGLADPRLAVHATSALPAWLWSIDGTRVLWANPVAAQLFGAANGATLSKKMFGPADPHRRQVAQLAGRLPQNGAQRLERLRGFGAAPGMLATCGCTRLEFPDGSHGILITAINSATRAMPLMERLQRLVQGVEMPIAAFASNGLFIGASDAARALLGFRDLSEAGLDGARAEALKQGRVETPIGIGHMVLQRVGSGADVGLVALIAPSAKPAPPVVPETAPPEPSAQPVASEPEPVATPAPEPAADNEASAAADDTLAAFGWFDALTEEPQASAIAPSAEPEPIQAEPTPEVPAVETPQETPQVEAPEIEAPPFQVTPEETPNHGPTAYAVAQDTAPASAQEAPPAVNGEPAKASSWLDEPLPNTRRHPLRFMWQMDRDGRFSLGSDEFTRLIGLHTSAGFGRLWSDIAESFALDPEGRVMKAFATRDTWSNITLNWPVDGGGRLPVELSGLPIFDSMRSFAGYRGFGVCRDLDGLARLSALRRYEFFGGPPASPAASVELPVEPDPVEPDSIEPGPVELSSVELSPAEPSVASPPPELPEPIVWETSPSKTAQSETSHPTDLETSVETPNELIAETPAETPKNVVPFRPLGDAKPPSLTPVENNAFNELARQLSARLESETTITATPDEPLQQEPQEQEAVKESVDELQEATEPREPAVEAQGWLAQPEPPPRGEARRDKALLDLLPVGVLIYRLDRLLYANRALLARMGYDSLHALEEAGGLDALYVEPGVSNASSTSDTGTPVTISANLPADEHAPAQAIDARLHTISWDGDSALALIFSGQSSEAITAAIADVPAVSEPPAIPEPSPVGHANAEELGAILDTTAEGILMFDAEGNINSANRSAEALFGYDGDELIQRNLADLFAPESQHAVFDYLASIKSSGVQSLLDHGREMLGRVRQGGIVPLSVTMGRTRADGPNFFAVFRDLSQAKTSESELRDARRLAERAANAKSDMLARISHEVRTPLNAIIGFADVMITERFGTLGNERYAEYMKDIRASGERVISIINDLLDLSRIETGKLDLSFTSQNLNELVESCVAVMQPQANRERIIIRTSLAHMLPPVVADARALRQITLNLIGNSIHLANAGGQVIVSTALSDFGEVMLRVRDTGQGLNDNEVAAALEPFRTHAPSDQASDGAGVSLSLTKALVEANRAKFQIKTGGRSGTLIEVVFSHATVRA